MQDEALIRRAAAHDEAAFEKLMLLHQKNYIPSCADNLKHFLSLRKEKRQKKMK